MKSKISLLLGLIMFNFFQIIPLQAQESCGTEGTDFYLGFMPNATEFNVTVSLHISSQFDTEGSIYIGGTHFQDFSLSANSLLEIIIPSNHIADQAEIIQTKGIQVTTDSLISLYAENQKNFTSDAALIFPTQLLRKKYYTMCQDSKSGQRSQFLIVATEDNTEIAIFPRVETKFHKGGEEFTITLNKSETYLMQSTQDLTASRITANKNIAVFSGNTLTEIPVGTLAGDHLYEQIQPLQTWGENFVTTPLATRAYDVFRVVASKNNTRVEKNSVLLAVLDQGEFIEFDTQNGNTPQVITASEPIMLTQFATSSDTDNIDADPMMMMLNPDEQTLKTINFETFKLATATFHYTNILTESNNTANILLDNNLIANWTAIAGSDFAYTEVSVSQGIHRIRSTSSEGFIAYAYGFGDHESYGYSAGMNLGKIVSLGEDIEACKGEMAILSVEGDFENYLWNTGETSPTIQISETGTYWVQVSEISGCTKTSTLHATFHDPNLNLGNDRVLCPDQTITLDAGAGFTSYLWSDNSTNQTLTLNSGGLYWVEVLDNSTSLNCTKRDSITIEKQVPIIASFKDSLIEECGELPYIQVMNLTSGATVFKWDFGDGTSSNLKNPAQFQYLNSGTYTISLTASNPHCPLLTQTTSTLVIVSASPPNVAPILSSTLTFNTATQCFETQVNAGETLYFELTATDLDNDTLDIEAVGQDFTLLSAGMIFNSPRALPILSASFLWSPSCDLLTVGLDSTIYEIEFILNDTKDCQRSVNNADTICVKITLFPPPIINNTAPVASSSLVFDFLNQVYRDTVLVNNATDFNFEITDAQNNPITFELLGQGFDMTSEGMTYTPNSGVGHLSSHFNWQTDCSNLDNGLAKTYKLKGIVNDYGLCGNVEATDTVDIEILVLPPPLGNPPTLNVPLAYEAMHDFYFDTLKVGQNLTFTLQGSDAEHDELSLVLEGQNFNLQDRGVTFQSSGGQNGLISGLFNWRNNCQNMQGVSDTTEFIFNAILSDFNECGNPNFKDTTKIHIIVLPPLNTPPRVYTNDLTYNAARELYTVEINFGDSLVFDVLGEDSNGDIVTLGGEGLGFDLANLKMEFQPIRDLPTVSSHFRWLSDCSIYDKINFSNPYLIEFVVFDEGNCAADASDTMRVEIIIKDIPNQIPTLSTNLSFNASLNCYQSRITVGDTLKFDVLATDLNQDTLSISGEGLSFDFSDLGMEFTSVNGIANPNSLISGFSWATDFTILADNQDSMIYELNFKVNDTHCVETEICVKITLLNCQTPQSTGLAPLSNFCQEGDTLGYELPINSDYSYSWSSDVGIQSDAKKRLIFVQKAGIYRVKVQHLAEHCIFESQSIVKIPTILLDVQDTVICQNQIPIKLAARDLANPAGFIYQWRKLSDTSSVLQSDTLGVLEVDSSGFYLIKVIDPITSCFKTDTVKVSIQADTEFTILANQNPSCADFVDLRIDNPILAFLNSIQWTVQNTDSTGFFEGSTSNLTAKILKSGRYIATLTNLTTKCQASQFIDIVINEKPKINLDPNLKDSLICQDTDFTIDAFDVSHGLGMLYKWKNLTTNQVISDSSKLVLPFTNFEKTAYQITLTNPLTSCQSQDTIQLQFVKQPLAKIEVDKIAICVAEELSLRAKGGSSYLWNTGDTTAFLTFIPDSTGIYTFILEAKNQNSCVSSFDSLQIEVIQLPIVTIESHFGICQNDSTAFLDVKHSSHSSKAVYKWFVLGDTTSLSTTARIDLKIDEFKNKNIDVSQPFDLIVQVWNAKNSCSASDTLKIEFGKEASNQIERDFPKQICLGESITLRSTGSDSVFWSTGDSTNSIRIIPKKIGYERIILFANHSSTCPQISDTVYIKVNPLPEIDFYPADSLTVCYGDTLTFIPTGGQHYFWQHEPNAKDTVFVVPIENTTYYLFGTDSNACQNVDSLYVKVRPTIDLPKEIQVCKDDFLEIGAESLVEATYFWTPGGFRTAKIKVKRSGVYSVEVRTEDCVYSRSVEVLFANYPRLKTMRDTTFCFEEAQTHWISSKIANFDSMANYHYTWFDQNANLLAKTDSLEITKTGIYTLEVFDDNLKNSCPTYDSLRVREVCQARIYVPTGFSPNGDGLNDRFTIYGKHLTDFSMQIYDRWGGIIYYLERKDFEDINFDEFWDGKLKGKNVDIGRYFWIINYKTPLDRKREAVKLSGQIDIIR